jgi:hypothetical protein
MPDGFGVYWIVKDKDGYVREVDDWFMSTAKKSQATKYYERQKAVDVSVRRESRFARVIKIVPKVAAKG